MSIQSSKKLQSLLAAWPNGTIATSKWLAEMAIPRSLAHNYKRSGWIKQFGKGAFLRSQDKIEWYGALYALQSQLDLHIHIGGKTAIEQHGLAHYVTMGRTVVDLLKTPNTRIPTWFLDHPWSEKIRTLDCGAFHATIGIEIHQIDSLDVKISSRERAALELLYLTPRLYSFDEVPLIMESLASLRGDVLIELLSHCTSEKVKRLILYFGEVYGFSWYKSLEREKIPIGSSLLKIATKNGKYISRYNMSIPQEYIIENGSEIKF